jgi:hypothetical protein
MRFGHTLAIAPFGAQLQRSLGAFSQQALAVGCRFSAQNRAHFGTCTLAYQVAENKYSKQYRFGSGEIKKRAASA